MPVQYSEMIWVSEALRLTSVSSYQGIGVDVAYRPISLEKKVSHAAITADGALYTLVAVPEPYNTSFLPG
jgi:hypothetical protein